MQLVDSTLTNGQQEPLPITFDDFWALYPRREAKKDARKAWSQISAGREIEILTALAAWRPTLIQRGDYCPLPASWLRGERFEDELPGSSTHASHAPAAIPAKGERSSMPEHVRAMIARLKR